MELGFYLRYQIIKSSLEYMNKRNANCNQATRKKWNSYVSTTFLLPKVVNEGKNAP